MYSFIFNKDQIYGKALLQDIDASYKDLVEVCSNIKGSKVKDAINFLERVIEGKAAVRYKKYTKKLAHRKELKGKPGRYPKKAAKFVLKALKNAINSAKLKGLSEEQLVIIHAAANKKNIYPRLASKGLRIPSYYETAKVEIIVKEISEHKKEEKKEEKKEGENK